MKITKKVTALIAVIVVISAGSYFMWRSNALPGTQGASVLGGVATGKSSVTNSNNEKDAGDVELGSSESEESSSAAVSGGGGYMEPNAVTGNISLNPPSVLTSSWTATFRGVFKFTEFTDVENYMDAGSNSSFAGWQNYFILTPSTGSPIVVNVDPTPTQASDGSVSVVVRPHTTNTSESFSTLYSGFTSTQATSYTVQACTELWNNGSHGLGQAPKFYVPSVSLCSFHVPLSVPPILSPAQGALGQSCTGWLGRSSYSSLLGSAGEEVISSYNPATAFPGSPFTNLNECAYHTTNSSLLGQYGNCILKPSTFTDSKSYPTASCTNTITTMPANSGGQTVGQPHGAPQPTVIQTLITMIQGLHA